MSQLLIRRSSSAAIRLIAQSFTRPKLDHINSVSVAKNAASILKLNRFLSSANGTFSPFFSPQRLNTRSFHSTVNLRSDGSRNDDAPPEDPPSNNRPKDPSDSAPLVIPSMTALAPVHIPEFFPKVPIVACSNPLFPRFIKMIEVFFLRSNSFLQNKIKL